VAHGFDNGAIFEVNDFWEEGGLKLGSGFVEFGYFDGFNGGLISYPSADNGTNDSEPTSIGNFYETHLSYLLGGVLGIIISIILLHGIFYVDGVIRRYRLNRNWNLMINK